MADNREQNKVHKTEITVYSKANRETFGDVVEYSDNFAKLSFTTTKDMVIDESGMIHPGYIVSVAIYAAACAANDQLALPVETLSKFITPLEKGKVIEFKATASHSSTRTRDVRVVGKMGDVVVYEGDIKLVVVDKHPLSIKLTT
jgi:acyl-coenzyme A thioesterase PaaI-like protein